VALTLECARLLGRLEAGEATEDERAALRLVTPLAKLMTGKQAVAVVSEALEAFGGAAYVEDTGLPVWLRDAQVLPIWEGTTNVLSLDVARAIARDGVLEPWIALASRRLAALRGGPADALAGRAQEMVSVVPVELRALAAAGGDVAEATARRSALRLAAIATAVPLIENADAALRRGHSSRAALSAARWLERVPRLDLPEDGRRRIAEDALLAMVSPPEG
jgi:hypothetical protein